jgi:myo-inositol-1(or 4)-monophosphatase
VTGTRPPDQRQLWPVVRDLAAARELAVDLAVAAGRLQVARRGTLAVSSKAHANDLVSDVDLASEKLIVEGVAAIWPGDGILAEEGSRAPASSGWRWVIDPLDGTRNYLTGAGPWSVCIALQEGTTTRMAVVHDPVAGETFAAVAGSGAVLGRLPLQVTATTRLDEAIVSLSFNPSSETKRRMARMLAALLPEIGDLRRVPAALSLVYVAAGRFDAALMVDTQLWDVAAGLLIAIEAGAAVDEVPSAGPGVVLATAPALRAELVRLASAGA